MIKKLKRVESRGVVLSDIDRYILSGEGIGRNDGE